MQKCITSYLTKVYQGDVNASEAKEISGLMRMTNNIERIGDSVENIALMIEDVIEDKIEFPDEAIVDINNISSQVSCFLDLIITSMQTAPNRFMEEAQNMEDNIDFMREEMRQAHIERLRKGQCGNAAGLKVSDMLSNFEKMGDYCYNIAQAIAGIK